MAVAEVCQLQAHLRSYQMVTINSKGVRMQSFPRIWLAVPLFAITLLIVAMPSEVYADERRSKAAAQFPTVTLDGFKLQRKDFNFFDTTAWLKRNGEWHIEGNVAHRGLQCATYELGMRFGVGKPDCDNVQWVSETRYITSQAQCNNAEMPHAGTEVDDTALAGHFDAITCAERVIRCTGNCK